MTILAEPIAAPIRAAQAAAGVERSTGRELRFVLSGVDRGQARDLAATLAASDGIEVLGEPLFPAAAGELSRFVLLRIPGIGFDELGGNPFDPANDLAEDLGAAAAEPDVAVAAEPGPESEVLGCWVGGDPPADRMWAPRLVRAPEAWAFSEAVGQPARGEGILIGHIDTGVADHAELAGAVDLGRGYDFVDDDPD
ncbi:MAG TPA: hypothetical protein VFY87_04970, partial [Geminicoccaceae bacterium]|nr:hypothetical protein [Geminicoccaceae bacterium]